MDAAVLLNLGLVLFFIVLGGVFAGTEMALVSLRSGQLYELESGGRRGQRTADLARNPNRFLSAVQIGVTLSGFFSAAYGASSLAPYLAPLLVAAGLAEPTADSLAFICITLLVAYLSLVFSELVPKRLAMQNALGFTRVLAPPLGFFAQVMRPVIWLLSVSTNLVLRAMGANPNLSTAEVDSAELRDMLAHTSNLPAGSRAILADVFGAGERTVQQAMRPRTEVSFLSESLTLAEAREHTAALPYSRYPVIGEDTDDVLGFVHLRDLHPAKDDPQRTVGQVLRELPAVPGTKRILSTLTQMRAERQHIALVVDEYGGTDGIVTFEDLIEELVGEVYDEFDTAKDPEDRIIRRDNALLLDGALITGEFAALTGQQLPEGSYDTVAGFIIARLGRMPQVGDRVTVQGTELSVQTLNGRRIGWVRAERAAPPASKPGG